MSPGCQSWPGGSCPIPSAEPHRSWKPFWGNWRVLEDTPFQNIPKVLDRWRLVVRTGITLLSKEVPPYPGNVHYLVQRSGDEVQQRTWQLISGFNLCNVAHSGCQQWNVRWNTQSEIVVFEQNKSFHKWMKTEANAITFYFQNFTAKFVHLYFLTVCVLCQKCGTLCLLF